MTRILVRSPKALIDRPVVLDRDLMLRVPAVHRRAGRGALAASGQPLETTQAHSRWRRCGRPFRPGIHEDRCSASR